MSVIDPATGDVDGSALAYEQLRSHVLTGSAAAGGHFALVVLLREGIAAWLNRRPTCSVAAHAAAHREQPMMAAPAFDDLNAGVVRVLASMAMSGRGEMRP